LCLIGSRWGTPSARDSIRRAIANLTFFHMPQGGYTLLISLREMAASLCFHWAAAGALYQRDYRQVAQILQIPIRTSEGTQLAVNLLPLIALDSVDWRLLNGYERRHTAHSDFMYEVFEREARDIAIGSEEVNQLWSEAEFIIALEFAHHRRLRMANGAASWFWTPLGRFVWRRDGATVSERLDHVLTLDASSPELEAGLLGGRAESAVAAATEVRDFISKNASSWIH
jgi:hypothetical protein